MKKITLFFSVLLALLSQSAIAEKKQSLMNELASSSELSAHGWQINKVSGMDNFKTNQNDWLFNFSKTGHYQALGACNNFSGKFKATEEGEFRLGQLDGSNNPCLERKDEEVMVFNMLLMADSFAIENDELVLKSGGKVTLGFKPNNQAIHVAIAHKMEQRKAIQHERSKKTAGVSAAKRSKGQALKHLKEKSVTPIGSKSSSPKKIAQKQPSKPHPQK